ncbi:MAG: hypothetical protein IJW20_04855 [Clostridia bacterium]|nr:hypothetical protein [Clostridia bacterium]
MIYVVFVVTCAVIGIAVLYIAHSNSKNVNTAFDEVDSQQIIKEIEKLDDISNGIDSSKKIMVPDNVDINDSTLKSTQDMDCKQYTVSTNNKITKTVIATENKNDNDLKDAIISEEDNDDDDPIKNI